MDQQDEDAVRMRAYQIWESKGRPDGDDAAHWQQALEELGVIRPFELPIGESVASVAKATKT